MIETPSTHCGWSKNAPNKSKMANRRILAKSKNLNIFATDWPIVTKFCKLIRLNPLDPDRPKNRDFKNPRWRLQPRWQFEKSQYLCNGTTNFDEIWYSDASEPHRYRQQIKNSRFRKSKMAAAAILKNRKIMISSQPIDRFWQNFAYWCVSTFWTPITNKISRIQKSKMAAAATLRICKIEYRRNGWPILMRFGRMMRLGPPDTLSQ